MTHLTQYTIKKQRPDHIYKMVRDILWIVALMSIGVFICMLLGGKGNVKIISPIAFSAFTAYAEEPILKVETSEQQQIVDYINEVFGSHADTAFKLLKCENGRLNSSAVNTAGNFPVGSRDIGVFQINEYWQKTQGKFLFNWKVNVEIAHQLYAENGNSFKLWSCGKALGI